jgi:glycine/D-amino acid oxidase-like deaminating enzyme/nitrite reductase/ring-hydroxylating ferredoxin subunit
MASVWFEGAPDAPRYPLLEGSVDADVIVVGGGVAGAVAAWRAASRGKRVILLEQSRLAAGDTGLTTAMLTRVPDAEADALAKRHGRGFLRRVFEATGAAQKELFSIIMEEGLDCEFAPCDTLHYAYRAGDPDLKKQWEAVKDADPHAHFLPDAAHEAGIAAAVEAITYEDEGRFHPRKFVLALLSTPTARERVRVFEGSGLLSAAVSGGVLVKTRRGEARAPRLVLAAGWPPDAFKELRVLLEPKVSYVIAARTKGRKPFADRNFWDTEAPYNYFRWIDGERFVLGGVDRGAEETIPLEEARGALETFLKTRLRGECETVAAWSGSLFFSEDGLPYVGPHPWYGGRVLFVGGLGGNGMVMGSMAGLIAGDLAAGIAHPHAELFSLGRTRADKRLVRPKPAGAGAKPWRWIFPIVWLAVLAMPALAFFGARGGTGFLKGLDFKTLRLLTFPLLGLYAFTLIWAQLVIGANMRWLRRLFPRIETFHRTEGIFALVFALAHPLFLATGLGLAEYLKIEFVDPRLKWAVLLGDLQLLLLVTTVATALLMKRPWLRRRWHLIHYANYAVFAMVWVHSWTLGSDVRTTSLKWLWFFFGATGIASAVMRFWPGTRGLSPSGGSAHASGAGWTRAMKLTELEEGRPSCANVGERKLMLVRLGPAVHALDNVCTHAGGPLCNGRIEGTEIECPWHQSRFDVRTGEVRAGPAAQPQPRYETRIKDGEVEVKI